MVFFLNRKQGILQTPPLPLPGAYTPGCALSPFSGLSVGTQKNGGLHPRLCSFAPLGLFLEAYRQTPSLLA